MSPGYDHAHHEGFERAADQGCLTCHAGQMKSIGGALNRLVLTEVSIGCERCHGPGETHVAKWRDKPVVSGGRNADASIVHPGQLSRQLNEAVCAQCHLRGAATVVRSGHSLSDFRPGIPLTEVRIDYRLESDSGDMKVVGHVDQMHASRCWQKSSTLTCTTCHDMHAGKALKPTQDSYRNKCLECHNSSSCGSDLTERLQLDSADNCVKCHMPQVPTDIPHIAFTHHRIGVHSSETTDPAPKTVAGRLVPVGDLSGLSDAERQRCLGLAYAELSEKQTDRVLAGEYRNRAIDLLKSVVDGRSADGDVFAALSLDAWQSQVPTRSLDYALQALGNPSLSDGARVNSLLIAGDSFLQARNSKDAVPPLEQLVKLRRRSEDWRLLGIARFQCGQKETGLAAMQQSIEIQPFRRDLHETLSDMYRSLGKTDEAETHRQVAAQLHRLP